jgi:hypothetical protein
VVTRKRTEPTSSPSPGDEARSFEKLKTLLEQVGEERVSFGEEVFNRKRWLVGHWSLTVDSRKDERDVLRETMALYDVYYLPTGKVTAADVQALRERTLGALIRPVTVVAAADGFDPKALASLKRSKWIDYFDEQHTPAAWLTAFEQKKVKADV